MPVLRPKVFRNMETDINDSAIVDASFNIIDMTRIDFNISNDLVSLVTMLPYGSAVVEQVFQNVLPSAPRTFPRLLWVISASQSVKLLNV